MGENLSKVVRNGFDTYRHNPKISIPFLLYLLLILSLLISMMIPLHYGGMNPEELFPLWFLIFLLAISIGSFFLAGTVGMAKEATLEGKTSLGTMWMEERSTTLGFSSQLSPLL